jgi:hypothetical protein
MQYSIKTSAEFMKTIIIVAPHFPPSALPPAQRVRLLVKHLRDFGYEPLILTVRQACREEAADPWMTELAGDRFRLVELPALPQKWTRRLGIGDLGLRFLPFLLPALLRTARRERPAFILYPVPPWYVLLPAPIVRALTGVPYGIDFIDPWYYDQPPEILARQGAKQRASLEIARMCEKWVVRHAALVFAVSEGINDDLKKRHPELAGIPMKAIPYGAEPGDFALPSPGERTGDRRIVRYIGAVWEDAYPVLDPLFAALAAVAPEERLRIEFYGTSYAGAGLERPQLGRWRERHRLDGCLEESPRRVPYRAAVELTLGADLLLLFGGVKPYYAASKLMGLIASRRPFAAFLHRDSFPAQFLRGISCPYLVEYGDDITADPGKYVPPLVNLLREALDGGAFRPVSLEDPRVREHTASGMTKSFVDEIDRLLAAKE